MKGWKDIGSDMSWSDYGGKWARRSPDGSYYVIDWTNMYDACGEEECKRDGQSEYVCEVKRVNLAGLRPDNITSALQCVGLRLTAEGIVSESGDLISGTADSRGRRELVLVEACVAYGCAEPIESFSGDIYPLRIRAEARRYAESCMRDAGLLAERLARPVNAIGSTAEEYGRGDIDAALSRGPFDMTKQIMRKMQGLPPGKEET